MHGTAMDQFRRDLTYISSNGVIPSAAVFQTERGISRGSQPVLARSLGPLIANAGLRDDASGKRKLKPIRCRRTVAIEAR